MFRKKLHLFKSLDTLKILTFWNIIKDDNIYLLDSGYFEGKIYKTKETNEIKETWLRLYDEYFVLRDESKSKRDLIKGFESVEIKWKLKTLDATIKSFQSLFVIEYHIPVEKLLNMRINMYKSLEMVSSRIKFNHFSSISEDIIYINKFFVAMQNTYNLNYKPKEKINEEQVKNVYDVVASVESWLERSLPIDDINVSRWLSYEKQVLDKQKKQKDGK